MAAAATPRPRQQPRVYRAYWKTYRSDTTEALYFGATLIVFVIVVMALIFVFSRLEIIEGERARQEAIAFIEEEQAGDFAFDDADSGARTHVPPSVPFTLFIVALAVWCGTHTCRAPSSS
jgi:hypothetical protein